MLSAILTLVISLFASAAPAALGTSHAARPHPVKVTVSAPFFGVHDSRLDSLTRAGTGSIRLWDTGTAWNDIEVRPGVYNWTRLDQIVTAAQARNVQVTLVLAMTPRFYASTPQSMPPMSAWVNYVRAVMNRYKNFNGKRGIAAYQSWNEANVIDYWSGTQAQVAQLNRAVWQVRNVVDPGALVISPSMTTRLDGQLRWLNAWANTKVGPSKTPVWKYDDAVALSLYPLAVYGTRPGTPEDTMTQLAAARSLLAKAGAGAIPIWNAEVNYGLVGGPTHPSATPISDSLQAAYVMRTYLLNAAAGVKRVYWYSYDIHNFASGAQLANTLLTNPATGTGLTEAGRAFYLVQSWMKGTMIGNGDKLRPCTADKAGTYTCMVKDAAGVKRIYWNPTKTVRVTLHTGTSAMQDVGGVVSKARGGQTISVGSAPVMVRSKS